VSRRGRCRKSGRERHPTPGHDAPHLERRKLDAPDLCGEPRLLLLRDEIVTVAETIRNIDVEQRHIPVWHAGRVRVYTQRCMQSAREHRVRLERSKGARDAADI
jgi:hypothetical protein